MRGLGLIAVAALGLAAAVGGDEPARTYEVVSPKDDGIVATGINGRGDVIGFEWIEEKERPGVLSQVPFYARGKEVTYLPVLAGYTATFPAAVSDDGLVVGRASKPAPPGVPIPLRNQAFVWSAKTGIRGLGVLAGDAASFASGITRDGRRISGFSVGGGERLRACVWERDGDAWKGTPLPQESRLGSNVVAISGDGNFVAGVDGGAPCLWSRDAAGAWRREVLGGAGTLVPRAVNDRGMVVGVRFDGDGRSHAVVWTRDRGLKSLEEPRGFVGSEASAVNNAGVVVGRLDTPPGAKDGPRAFVAEEGRLRLLDEGGKDFTAATAINDRGQVAGVLEKEEDEPAPAKPDPAGGAKK